MKKYPATPDRFRIRAEMPVRMTDFGITPPTALFGIVKARNELTVRFERSAPGGAVTGFTIGGGRAVGFRFQRR